MKDIKLLHGDCLEIMKSIPDKSIDLVLTDPPYGTTACKWDVVIPFEPMWKELKRIRKDNAAIVLFGSEPFSFILGAFNLQEFKYAYSWIKTKASNFQHARRMPMKRHENILVFSKAKVNFYLEPKTLDKPVLSSRKNKGGNLHGDKIKDSGSYYQKETGFKFSDLHFPNPSGKGQYHPTQKPVALLEYLIKTYTLEGETVLDFTMGSGSTGVAAKNLNRKFIGIEQDDKYFEIAKKRIYETLVVKGTKSSELGQSRLQMVDFNKLELTTKQIREICAKYIRTKDEDKKHHEYSPSGMARIMGCKASVRTNKGIPSQDNKYSIRGTHTHTLMEFLFKEDEKLLRHVGASDFKKFIGYDSEMHECAMAAVRHVRAEMKRMHAENGIKPTLIVERKVSLKDVVKVDCAGTSDIILYQLFGVLHVMDYKNGTSVEEATENKQMMTYALAALHELGWDFSEVWMTIIQPNASHKLGPVRTWKTTIKRMEGFERELRQAIKDSKDPDAEYTINSKWCYFCPANQAKKCPAQNAISKSKLLDKFIRPLKGETNGKGKKEIGFKKETRKEKSFTESF